MSTVKKNENESGHRLHVKMPRDVFLSHSLSYARDAWENEEIIDGLMNEMCENIEFA